MMREWPYTASNRDVLGCTSPPTSRFPSALEMSLGLRPRDISRASGNLLVVGDVQPNTSLLSAVCVYNASGLEAVYGHSLIINPSLGMYQEIHPCRASSTYSVEINTSLPMIRECVVRCPLYNMVDQTAIVQPGQIWKRHRIRIFKWSYSTHTYSTEVSDGDTE